LDADVMRRVHILPMQPEQAFLAAASTAWFGVVTLSPDMQTHNIPGKLLAYLAAGIPVFVMGPRDAALADVVRGMRIGRYADAADERAVRETLRELIEGPGLRTGDRAEILKAREAFSTRAAAEQILASVRVLQLEATASHARTAR